MALTSGVRGSRSVTNNRKAVMDSNRPNLDIQAKNLIYVSQLQPGGVKMITQTIKDWELD